ncbi:mediator of DNA damage checkpoint protein 1 isoform X2 [Anthonomus grandis grandis]|uniref:mediator of DNA damage checkpoint protein 1 isoform X2 n=1 Tax=Anthonomus grandis grandis TaxID=2921223 RepID=UPI0021652670|nr:mediator of DNA damage checkpoint protein 1 isoform X2 [Anthonomus grandis grandis]
MENSCDNTRPQVALLKIKKKTYRIYEGVNTIGCHTNAVVSINDENVDIHHAVIVAKEGENFISDLNSSGQTFVDGTQLVPYKLYELIGGTNIGFGELLATFQLLTSHSEEEEPLNIHEAPTQIIEHFGEDIHDATTQVVNWEQVSTTHPIPPPPLFNSSAVLDQEDNEPNLIENVIFEEPNQGVDADITCDELLESSRHKLDCETGNSDESLELLNYDMASSSIDTSKRNVDSPEKKSVCAATRTENADSGSDTEEELEAMLNEGSDTDAEVQGLTKVTTVTAEDSFQRPSISFIDKSIPATQYAGDDLLDDSDIVPGTQVHSVKPQESQENDNNCTEGSFKLGLTQMIDEEDIYEVATQRVGPQLNQSIRTGDGTFFAPTQKVFTGEVKLSCLSVIEEQDIAQMDDSDILDATISPRASCSKTLESVRKYMRRSQSKSENQSQNSVAVNEESRKDEGIIEEDFQSEKHEDVDEASVKMAEVTQIVEIVLKNALEKGPNVVDFRPEADGREVPENNDKLMESNQGHDKLDVESPEKAENFPEKVDEVLQETAKSEKEHLPAAEESTESTTDQEKPKRFIWKKRGQQEPSVKPLPLHETDNLDKHIDIEKREIDSVDQELKDGAIIVEDIQEGCEVIEKPTSRRRGRIKSDKEDNRQKTFKTTTRGKKRGQAGSSDDLIKTDNPGEINSCDVADKGTRSCKKIKGEIVNSEKPGEIIVMPAKSADLDKDNAGLGQRETDGIEPDSEASEKDEDNKKEIIQKSFELNEKVKEVIDLPLKLNEVAVAEEPEAFREEEVEEMPTSKRKSTDSVTLQESLFDSKEVIQENVPEMMEKPVSRPRSRMKSIESNEKTGEVSGNSGLQVEFSEGTLAEELPMSKKEGAKKKRRRKSTDSLTIEKPSFDSKEDGASNKSDDMIQEQVQGSEIMEKPVSRLRSRRKSTESNEKAGEVSGSIDLECNLNEAVLVEETDALNEERVEKESQSKKKKRRKSTDSVTIQETLLDSKEDDTSNESDDVMQERVPRLRNRIKTSEPNEKTREVSGSIDLECNLNEAVIVEETDALNEEKVKKESKSKKDGPKKKGRTKSTDSVTIEKTSFDSNKSEELMHKKVQGSEMMEKPVPRLRSRIKSTDSNENAGKASVSTGLQFNLTEASLAEESDALNEETKSKKDGPKKKGRRKSTDSVTIQETFDPKEDDTSNKPDEITDQPVSRLRSNIKPTDSDASVEQPQAPKKIRGKKPGKLEVCFNDDKEIIKERASELMTDPTEPLAPTNGDSKKVPKKSVKVKKPQTVTKRRLRGRSSESSVDTKPTQSQEEELGEPVEKRVKKEVEQKEVVRKQALKRERRLRLNESDEDADNGEDDVKEPRQTSSTDPMNHKKVEPLRRSSKRAQKGVEPKTVKIKEGINNLEAFASHSSLTSAGDMSEGSLDAFKGKKVKKEATAITDSPQRESSRRQKHKVVFTLMENPLLESQIRQLGGSMGTSMNTCTVLVTESIKRTPKLLSAVGLGKPICSPNWILESKKAHEFLDPWEHILTDPEAEKKWDFSLKESLNRSRNQKILMGYTFVNQCQDKAEPLKAAIESCGGKYLTKTPTTFAENTFIISPSDNKPKLGRLLKNNPQIKIIESEAVVDGVLRQELRFHRHFLN